MIFGVSLVVLMSLGAMGARLGGARMLPAAIRVGFWGVVAMGLTALIGRLAGVSMT
jgi:VIT1/CCC1 family predicted Fe2+/Mn2+ transporter